MCNCCRVFKGLESLLLVIMMLFGGDETLSRDYSERLEHDEPLTLGLKTNKCLHFVVAWMRLSTVGHERDHFSSVHKNPTFSPFSFNTGKITHKRDFDSREIMMTAIKPFST